ncbi:hypothetical protein C9374_005858 [Naegleria lovaniensis]|uniref:DUF4116 domain-containing protein n=1 Tax=Naegleria lovaniensis TaxID=51637 RepID=A0AA88GJC3_NAELO|nr:uncharacterized protein C9374_005858 [Naegleria lovaniensis]KAG2382066.1 hypothetical protein C9374_005858 [Naegleria lovaniensis]
MSQHDDMMTQTTGVRILLVDFYQVDFDHIPTQDLPSNMQVLLKKNFSWQLLGKKKWFSNRELKYENFFPVEFMNDPEFVLNHIKKYGYGLKFASTQLKKDRDFVLKVVQHNGLELRFADEPIRNDKEVVLAAAKENYRSFSCTSKALRSDKEYVLKVVKQNGKAIFWGYQCRNYKQVALATVKQKGTALKYIRYNNSSNSYWYKPAALEAFKLDKKTLHYVSHKLLKAVRYVPSLRYSKWYQTVALEAIKQDKKALRYVSEDFLQRHDFMLQALKLIFPEEFETSFSFDYSSKEIMMKIIQEFGFLLEFVSNELKCDREIVLSAVRNHGRSLEFASNNLKNDKEIALLAVQQDGWALNYASTELRRDKQVVLAAVNQNGIALQFVPEELENDREVVLTAVAQNGDALIFASDKMKKDRQVVLTAVKQYGRAIVFADYELKSDPEIWLEVSQLDVKDLQKHCKDLLSDRQFLLKIAKFVGHPLLSLIPTEVINDDEFMVTLTDEIKSYGSVSEYSDELYQERMETFYYGVYSGSSLDMRNE